MKINLQQTAHRSRHKDQLRSGTMTKINMKQKGEVVWEGVKMCVYDSKHREIKKEAMWGRREWLFESSKLESSKKMWDQRGTSWDSI